MRVALVGVASVLMLAGCGNSAQLDRGGFTASDRKVAQAVLAGLGETSIPTALLAFTTTAAAAPAVCRVHLESTNPRTFKLFLFWIPNNAKAMGTAYTWFEATLREGVLQDTFHVGHSDGTAAKAQVLKSHSGDAFSKPVEECQVLMNGHLRLSVGSHSNTSTTGNYAPISALPVLSGVGVDPDAMHKAGTDLSSVIRSLGNNHYQLVVTNTSSIGFINTFTWAPPAGATIMAVSSNSDCRLLDGLISCSLALRPPTCTCRGDGGRVTIGFTAKARPGATTSRYGWPNSGNGNTYGWTNAWLRIGSETPVPYVIPSSPLENPARTADLPLCKKGQLGTTAQPCIQQG
jgi:hypothetical protein